jgi:hypothetical protein
MVNGRMVNVMGRELFIFPTVLKRKNEFITPVTGKKA